MFNYSFWADEAYISSIAARLVNGQIPLFDALNLPGISYQKLHMLTVAASFKLFGISEVAGRAPAFFAFVIGAVLMFFLAKRVGNIYAAIVSTFLYTFSHLNLAYATQAKPYAAIETLTIAVMLLLHMATKEKGGKALIGLNIGIIAVCTTATFFHFIGFLLWIIYFTYVGATLLKIRLNRESLTALILPAVLLAVLSVVFIIPTLSVLLKSKSIFSYNHLTPALKLFEIEYFFITLFATFGFFVSFSKNKLFSVCVLIYSLILFILASFEHYVFNIRYVLSLFGIVFLYFGVFWSHIAKQHLSARPWIVPVAVILIIYLTGYKIVRTPKAYFSPNIDKYGDVQIANYKDFYARLKKQYPDYQKIPVFNNTFDAEEWYFGRYSTAYFQKFTASPVRHPVSKRMIYGSLSDFKREMKKYPKGLVIVEDWESFLPEDIKDYVKANLKLEYRVEGLKEAPDDPWPIALYSWGM